MAERSTNTMSEMLQRFVRDIADAKTAMDADMPFLASLEEHILQYVKDPMRQMQAQGQLPQDPNAMAMGMGGMPPGGPPMGGPPPMAGPMPQAGGLMPGAAAPNADELRRLLG